jgi:dihydropteroate synthase
MIKAINQGADLINDVSGFNYENTSLLKLKKYNIAKVLHHMQGTPNTMQKNPKYKNVLLDIYDFFENNLEKIDNKKIILDPGIGFGKNLKHNLTLISKISLFHSLGFPILIGTSRKRFISQIAGVNDSKERIGGTIASCLFLLSQGVQVFRVHDVHEVKQSILVFKKILSTLKI